ncbi:helix-turn-helix domain-containing protein [Sphingomonas mesophila]|uniref:helix-turn-helix domain-containing protein n=1 Tax=Sphingomonas mesophila TaxID=2303576 RepID=UPI000E570519|nr:helix-turn-helix transcriptional regulator [Sphingomonas mesophila]
MRELEPFSDEACALMMEHEGTYLLFWREQRGLTQEQLAARSGLDLQRIQVLESDYDAMTAEEAAALAETLRVTPENIVMPDDMIGDTMLPYEPNA